MKDFRFNYIITIHNKQDLIAEVLQGVLLAWREGSEIYPVLDGCSDNTEKIIDEIALKNPHVPITKLYAPDVHEIRSINIALKSVPQDRRGCNIILQDDVVLKEPELESIVKKIYDFVGYEKLGCLVFRHGVNMYLNEETQTVEERDLIESAYGTGMSAYPLKPGQLVERMVGVRSPECISCEVVNKVGIMDEELAPYTYDNHDISLRCLQAGFKNYVFALPFVSEIKWGGTRTNPHPEYSRVLNRNKHYLYKKHYEFLNEFANSLEYSRLKRVKPVYVPSLQISEKDEKKQLVEYKQRRKAQVGLKNYFITKLIKEPGKKILISLGLY